MGSYRLSITFMSVYFNKMHTNVDTNYFKIMSIYHRSHNCFNFVRLKELLGEISTINNSSISIYNICVYFITINRVCTYNGCKNSHTFSINRINKFYEKKMTSSRRLKLSGLL